MFYGVCWAQEPPLSTVPASVCSYVARRCTKASGSRLLLMSNLSSLLVILCLGSNFEILEKARDMAICASRWRRNDCLGPKYTVSYLLRTVRLQVARFAVVPLSNHTPHIKIIHKCGLSGLPCAWQNQRAKRRKWMWKWSCSYHRTDWKSEEEQEKLGKEIAWLWR